MGDLTRNFSIWEFRCPCGCRGQKRVSVNLVNDLQGLRDLINGQRARRGLVEVPIKITSGVRCERHNAQVGGSPESYHLRGLAADIVIPRMDPLSVAAIAALTGWFLGIGWYPDKGHVHLDARMTCGYRWAVVDKDEMNLEQAMKETINGWVESNR